jgi:glycine/D-amino acid oxidase-like deaminating enzyme
MTDHENTPYDILILGGGPIGTSTLYNLTKSSKAGRIGLVTNDLKDDPRTTFMNSGGCINWDWPDPLKKQMMTETKDFLFGLIDEGVDLLENKDSYFSLYDGSYVPSLNISAARLVEYFKKQSAEKGATIHEDTEITSVTNNGELYTIVTNKGELKAKIVLLALGVTNEKFMPGMYL